MKQQMRLAIHALEVIINEFLLTAFSIDANAMDDLHQQLYQIVGNLLTSLPTEGSNQV